jgi:hypothetical protein
MAERRIKAFASHAQAFRRRGRILSPQHAESGGEAQNPRRISGRVTQDLGVLRRSAIACAAMG